MESQQLLKKLTGFSVGPIIGALLGLISTPLFTYFISPEEYGKASMYTVALTIIQLIVFLGMDQAYVKHFYGSEDRSELLTNAMAPSFVLVAIIDLCIVLFRSEISYLLFNSTEETLCVYVLVLVIPALAFERFMLLGIRMEQRGLLYSLMSVLLKILIIAFTLTLLLGYQKSFRSIALGNAIAEIIYAFILCFVQKGKFSIRPSLINRKAMVKLLKFGLPLVPTSIIGWALHGTDKVMMRAICSYEEIGLYSVAVKITTALTLIQSSFTNFWVPVAHEWNNAQVDNAKFVKTGRYVSCIMSIVFVSVLMVRDILFLLFKPVYADAAQIVPFLLFTPIMYTISEVTVMGIYFHEKTYLTVIVSVISATINIGLNAMLIPIWGAIGAAVATGISYICFFWARTMLSRRVWFDFPLSDYFMLTILLLIASAVSTFTKGVITYAANCACLLVFILYYKSEICEILSVAMRFLIRRPTKQN